jgi:Bacterial archaeo-eukaryotic release factor family 2
VRRTVVVADGEVLLDQQVPGGGPGAEGHAVHGVLPDVVGLVAAAGSWVPYVAVEASRVEASVSLRVAGRAGGEEHHVAGEDFHARKVRVGGWRHDHFQNHAEEVWRGNAEQVAAEVVSLVRRSGARLVVVAGDVRARQALEQELAGETRAEVVGVDVNALAEGSSDDQVEETLAAALSDHQRRRLDSVLDRLAAGLDPESAGGRTAVEGVPAVVEALQQAQVEVLLLHPVALGDERLAVLAEAPWVATGTGDQPVEPLGEAAAADALLRAASLTDAEVLVLEDPHPQLAAGAAAVLRWAAPSA